jgi:hypothetical protein
MSDFRVEQARIRLSDEIEGLDPNANLDPGELCWIDPTKIDAQACGATPLQEFFAADYASFREDDKWFPASDGLATVNALLQRYERTVAAGVDELGRDMTLIQDKIAQLREVARVLSLAEERGLHFQLAVTD